MATAIYGIVGHPVRHSLSPAMQNAAFRELGIDAEYRLYDVEPRDLERFLASIRREGLSGFNVTIPHKIRAAEYILAHGSLDGVAERLGAVNTVTVTDERLRGYNTDGPGFYRSLIEDLGFEPEGRRVFVLGAGGAAQSIVMYLGNGPERISVFDIDRDRASALKKQYGKYFDSNRLATASDGMGIGGLLAGCDLLVNATPVGMGEHDPSPVDKALFHPGLSVYDLVYNRPYTQLVKDANSLKLHAVTGLGMLLYQGAIALETWTGRAAPLGVMKKALRQALDQTAKGK